MTDLAIEFFKREKGVLLYGGAAINSLLAPKDKFYDQYELPDIDVFTSAPKSLMNRLRIQFQKAGHGWFNAYEALHPGTIKVMIEGIDIADIHYLPPSSFKLVYKGSLMGDMGIRTASPEYLRMTLYKQLSDPIDSHRWPKVFERLLLFNQRFPPAKTGTAISIPLSSETQKRIRDVMAFVATTEYLIMGADVTLMADDANNIGDHAKASSTYIDLIVDEPVNVVAERLQRIIPGIVFDIERVRPSLEPGLLPPHTFLTLNGERWIGLYSTNGNCYSYVEYRGYRFASLGTLLTFYGGLVLSRDPSYNIRNIDAVLNLLIAVQMRSLNSRKQLLNQFVLDCYGTQPGIFTLRRERKQRREDNKNVK